MSTNFKRKKKTYKQKFREEWLDEKEFMHWLILDPTDRERGYCLFCKCSLAPKYGDLLKHGDTTKHLLAVKQGLAPPEKKNIGIMRTGCWRLIKIDTCPRSVNPLESAATTMLSLNSGGKIDFTAADETTPVMSIHTIQSNPELEALRKRALKAAVNAEKEKIEYYRLKKEAAQLKIRKLKEDLEAAEMNRETQSILKETASFEYNKKINRF